MNHWWCFREKRWLARALAGIAALVCLCVPGRALAADRPIGFSNLVIRLENDEVGLASGDYRVHILEAMRGGGLTAVGAENLVFNQDEANSAELLLGGTVRELRCLPVKGRVNCGVGVEWEVLDVDQEAVVYKVMTRHAEYGFDERNAKNFGRRLVLGALRSLLARKGFRNVVAQPKRVESTSYPLTAFGACQASPLQLPAGFEDAAKATVLINTANGFGSGFFLGSDGLVLTAAHVVTGPTVELKLRDRTQLKARPIRISREHDVALLMAERTGGWPCLDLALGPKVPGTETYAIGAPASQDLAFSLTRGILSGVRQLDGTELLQTDASLSPGNSGGPLIDGSGRVLGIVSRKLAGTAVEGVGFAIPIDKALQALGLKPEAAGDPSLLNAPGVAVGRPAAGAIFTDMADAPPSLDPEGDAIRKAAEDKARRDAEQDRLDAERDARTPLYVKVMRWGGLGLASVGLIGAIQTQSQLKPDKMTPSEYEAIRTRNDISWVVVGVGAASFGVSWFLVPDAPEAKRSGRLNLQISPNHAALGGEF